MPYTYKKEGDKYAVYKKDTGKLVGKTKGTKEALKKYLAALHIHSEAVKLESMKPKQIKLASLLKLNENEDLTKSMSTEQKKAFLEAVYKFADHANSIYRTHNIKETAKFLGELIEAANHLTLSETEDWFDKVTVNRHMKHLSEAQKIFEKTAHEMDTLQQRLESAYEDIGSTLGKYYDIGSMVNEATTGDGKDYQKFFQKAMKKFKINSPEALPTEKSKKKFFNWVDANYKAKDEESKKDTESNKDEE